MQRQTSPKTQDPRWQALALVQAAMSRLNLRDRDIAVLRGLLSFIPAERWEGALHVHASNATLQERCGGIEERTLRRRLAHLVEVGLITRHQSPNRKRFVVRDEKGVILLAYGFDLSPLRAAMPRLTDLAEECAAEQLEVKALRAILRDAIFHAPKHTETVSDATKLLRRTCTPAMLRHAIDLLRPASVTTETPAPIIPMSDGDGQNVRHIQNSKKESFESKNTVDSEDLSLSDCLEKIPSALELSSTPIKSWSDLQLLAKQLAPALGIDETSVERSRNLLGHRGSALAILGLVQAWGKILRPANYFSSILASARKTPVCIQAMFHSMTRSIRFPAGNHHVHV